ncbi:hypothetical protein EVA_00688 [gut metagenome]|uniref:Uncharacterized protein n=1 Tax=gut metagenome TaxID=749906 RepID=J9H3V5_9ZZZZ
MTALSSRPASSLGSTEALPQRKAPSSIAVTASAAALTPPMPRPGASHSHFLPSSRTSEPFASASPLSFTSWKSLKFTS